MYEGVVETIRVIALIIVSMVLLIAITDRVSVSKESNSGYIERYTEVTGFGNVRNFNFNYVNKTTDTGVDFCSTSGIGLCD